MLTFHNLDLDYLDCLSACLLYEALSLSLEVSDLISLGIVIEGNVSVYDAHLFTAVTDGRQVCVYNKLTQC